MEGGAHRQAHHLPHTTRPGQGREAIDRGGGSGDHGLVGRIEIRRREDVALRCLPAQRLDLLERASEQSRHRALADGHRLLHVFAAPPHGAHGVLQLQGARGHEGRVLSE